MRILVLANSGIGGTEKAATIYASELSKRRHDVIYSTEEGPRTALLRENGVNLCPPAKDVEQLASLITQLKPDVIHQHVPGYWIENPLYEALGKLQIPKPKLVQTNVFGWLGDPRALENVDFHLFISKASGSQAFRRAAQSLTQQWLDKCSVVMYPMPEPNAPDPQFRQKFRKEHGISEKTLLAIRVGQPGISKWKNWEVKALREAVDQQADAKLILMQPPDCMKKEIEDGKHSDRIIILPVTSDFNYLNNLYHSADVMLHASSYGESFGYTIAEGMAAELPVICRSTPWGDSAQVELIDSGTTGWICATPREMGRRLADMANDRSQLKIMGENGKERISQLSDLHKEINILEEILRHLVDHQPLDLTLGRNSQFLNFSKELSTKETTFSEKNLPLTEKIEWLTYWTYRNARGKIGKLGKLVK